MTRFRRITLAFAITVSTLLASSAGCVEERPDTEATPVDRAEVAEWDIREAVALHAFANHGASLPENADAYLVSFHRTQLPPESFLARFADHVPPVIGTNARDGRGVAPQIARPISFGIGAVRWIDDDTADVEWSYHQSPNAGGGGTVRVQRVEGRWMVTRSDMGIGWSS